MNALILAALLLAPTPVKSARSRIVQLYRTSGGVCMGIPISSDLIFTASHCIQGDRAMTYRSALSQGPAEVLWEKKDKDVALLRAPGANFGAFGVAKKLPEETESVWAFCYINADDSYDLVEGRAMREHKTSDGRKLLFLDIAIAPGTSGGVLLNSAGEVVGLIVAGWHPMPEHPVGHIFFRPFAGAVSLMRGSLD